MHNNFRSLSLEYSLSIGGQKDRQEHRWNTVLRITPHTPVPKSWMPLCSATAFRPQRICIFPRSATSTYELMGKGVNGFKLCGIIIMKLLSLLLYLRLSPLTLCHSLFIPFIPRKQIDRAFSKMLRKYDRQGKDFRVTGV